MLGIRTMPLKGFLDFHRYLRLKDNLSRDHCLSVRVICVVNYNDLLHSENISVCLRPWYETYKAQSLQVIWGWFRHLVINIPPLVLQASRCILESPCIEWVVNIYYLYKTRDHVESRRDSSATCGRRRDITFHPQGACWPNAPRCRILLPTLNGHLTFDLSLCTTWGRSATLGYFGCKLR